MTEPRFITRKQIASLLEETTDVVRKNENRWGLKQCRAGFNRPVKYWRDRALQCLRACGLMAG